MASVDNTSGPAPKEKKSVRFNALYLQKKRNLLGYEQYLSNYYKFSCSLYQQVDQLNSGLMKNISSPTPTVPPTKNVWDKPSPNVDHPVPKVPTSVPAASTSLPSLTTVNQDAPSTSTSQTTSKQQSSVIPQGVEDDFYDIKIAHMDNDPYF
nr:hypothetical protein [Tanacetum cinerariifolium]